MRETTIISNFRLFSTKNIPKFEDFRFINYNPNFVRDLITDTQHSKKTVSFLTPEKLNNLLATLTPVWNNLTDFDKSTQWFYISGFQDRYNTEDIRSNLNEITLETPNIAKYLE